MATIYRLKPAFQNLLRPLCRALAAMGITANQVTLLAALISVAVGATLACAPQARWAYALVPATLFVRMALNAIDGMLAREHGQKSRLGALLNELCDVISDAALYLPFALIAGVNAGLVVAAAFIAVLTEMTGVIAVQIGAERRYDGPMGKSDRAFAFGLLALLFAIGIVPGIWSNWLLAAVAALGVLTVINRAQRALQG
jgi:CDP-diacylglycerol--glycerol-3-phosphate 3-phosphatidyltransferase